VCDVLQSTALHWFGGAELGLDRFVHHYLDLNTMQTRTDDRYYSNLEQFYADCCTIQHNIFVCFGGNTAVAGQRLTRQ